MIPIVFIDISGYIIKSKPIIIDIIETNDNDLLVLEVNSGVSIDKCTNFIKDGYNIAKSIYKEAVIEMFKDN